MSALDKAFIKAYTKGANPPGPVMESAPHQHPAAAYGPYGDSVPASPYPALEAMYGQGLMYRVDGPHRDGGLSAGSGMHVPLGPAAGPADMAYVGPYYDPGIYGPAPQFHTLPAAPVLPAHPLAPPAAPDPTAAGAAFGPRVPAVVPAAPAWPAARVAPAAPVIPEIPAATSALVPPTASPERATPLAPPAIRATTAPAAAPGVSVPSPSPAAPATSGAASAVAPNVVVPTAATSDSVQAAAAPLVPSACAASPPSSKAAETAADTLGLPSVFLAPDDVYAAREFAPDWEVDRFTWPAICDQLLAAESRYFEHVGQRLKAATEESHHVVMITGCRRGEGRTTLSLCLARCAAAAGVSVAILDADVKNPQLNKQLGIETPCGWLDVLSGKAPLNEAAVTSVEDGLTLFPLRPATGEAAGSAPLGDLLRRISGHYALVIVDVGPVTSEDGHPFADCQTCPVDAAIVVRDLRNTTEKKALATAEHLQRTGIPAVGIAENFGTAN